MEHGTVLHEFTNACIRGLLGKMKRIARDNGITVDDIRKNCILRISCEKGYLSIAKWLVNKFWLTVSDARAENNYVLRKSCFNGHLTVAQWLVNTFGLTVEDAIEDDNYALRESCDNGHLDVAQWLVNTFGLTVDDPRIWNNITVI